MEVHFPPSILEKLRSSGVVATFSVDQPEHGVPLVRSLVAGGIDAIELTLRTPAALDALREICAALPELLVGVGTILTPAQVSQVKEAGAAFGVAPGLNTKVLDAATDAGLPFAPGIVTPSELEAAAQRGCRLLKFFPAEPSGGVRYLRSLSAPYKHLGIQYIPLGGVNATNMLDYLQESNVLSVGGTWIVDNELVKTENWDGITQRAAQVRAVIDAQRTS